MESNAGYKRNHGVVSKTAQYCVEDALYCTQVLGEHFTSASHWIMFLIWLQMAGQVLNIHTRGFTAAKHGTKRAILMSVAFSAATTLVFFGQKTWLPLFYLHSP
jgi:hypothetical protein